MDYRHLTLPEIYAEAEAIAGDARRVFGPLTVQQLNWKPDARMWSVGQCLEHLVLINRNYFPVLDRIATGTHQRTLLHRVPFVPAVFGRLMIASLSPSSGRRLRAPRTAQPSSSSIDAGIVDRFVADQGELLAKMKSLEGRNLSGLIITSPFASVVVYSVLDAFRLLVAHERRHFAQARRVMETPRYPGTAHTG